MTVELLRYANRAKVAEALTAQGYDVTRMTVNRWAAGGEMPGIAQRMILSLFGHNEESPDQSLDWPGLVKQLSSIQETVTTLPDTLADRAITLLATPALLDALVDRLVGLGQLRGAEHPEESATSPGGADRAP